MPVAGGEPAQILPRLYNILAYSVTSKGIYFSPDGRTIQFLDLAAGRVNTLSVLDRPLHSMCVSPDDAHLVWPQLDKDSRDLMLVEGFR
jgi:hypothetical protein